MMIARYRFSLMRSICYVYSPVCGSALPRPRRLRL